MVAQQNHSGKINIQRTDDNSGNTIETRREYLPNGQIRISKIIKGRNGNILSYNSSIISDGNNMHNMPNFNMRMNNYNMIGMNPMNTNIMSGHGLSLNNTSHRRGAFPMNNNNNNMTMGTLNLMTNMNRRNNFIINLSNNRDDNIFNDIINRFSRYLNIIRSGNQNHGVEDDIMNYLEPSKLKDVSKLEDDKKNCVICMEDFKIGDEVLFIPCLHVFHKNCIIEWFKDHNDCPVCKFKLTSENINPDV